MPTDNITVIDTPKVQVTKKSFVMPEVCLGDPVIWSKGGMKRAALVTAVGLRSVSLIAFVPGAMNGIAVDGLRHRDDPDTNEYQQEQVGTWQHNRRMAQFIELFGPTTTPTKK